MEVLMLIFILGVALMLFVSGLVLLTFVRRGLSTLFFPGLKIVISTRLLLALVTVVEILLVGVAVIFWRAL